MSYQPAPAQISARAIFVWGLTAAFYFYEFLVQISPSVMITDIMQAFHVTEASVGKLSALYLYGYAAMQLPAGMLVDRFGPHRILTMASLICALGTLLFGLADGLYWVAALGRIMMGIGGGFAVVSCLKVTTLWFPSRHFALMTGFMVTVGMLGAAGAQGPVAALNAHFGWQNIIIYGGLVGLLLSAMVWTFVQDGKHFRDSTALDPNQGQDHDNWLEALKNIFAKCVSDLWRVSQNKQVWLASVFAALMFVPTLGFAGLWGVPYISERYLIEAKDAAPWVSLVFIGWVFGSPFFGWLSDAIFRSRKIPLFISVIATLLLLVCILYVPQLPLLGLGILLFLLGVFSCGFVLTFSVVKEISPALLSGTAIGFINTWNTLGGGLAQDILGRLLEAQGSQHLNAQGIPVYSLGAYEQALIALPCAIIIALLLLPFLQESHPKRKRK